MSARIPQPGAGPLLGWPESRRAAARVRFLRKQAEVKIKELAPLVGVSAPHLSELERGCNRWSEGYAARAAEALGTDLAGLLGDGDA